MCGIFGFLAGSGYTLSSQQIKSLIDSAFLRSESRGKEASGIAIKTDGEISVLKEPIAASRLIKTKEYRRLFDEKMNGDWKDKGNPAAHLAIIGHSRLVTNGKSELNTNNQPVVKNGAIGIHNGIVVNDAEIWGSFPSISRNYDIDTEALLGLLQMFRKSGDSPITAAKRTYAEIKGSASIAVLFDDSDIALLASNTGSLYTCLSKDNKMIIYASEKYILTLLLSHKYISNFFDLNSVTQVKAGNGILIDLLKYHKFERH